MFNDAVGSSNYIESNNSVIYESERIRKEAVIAEYQIGLIYRHLPELNLWIGEDLGESVRGLIQGTIPERHWRDWGKPRSTSVRIAGLRA